MTTSRSKVLYGLFCFLLAVLASPFKSKCRLEAENTALRHQLIVLRRKMRVRIRLTNDDRWFFIQLYRWFPSVLKVITVIRPETLVRWHRAGFRCYWRWKSGSRGRRPQISAELRALIRRMSIENALWGAPRIHGELLKLGFEVAQSSLVAILIVPFKSKCRLEAENVALRHRGWCCGVSLGPRFISRTSIGYPSSSFTIGFHRSGECLPSFSRRTLFGDLLQYVFPTDFSAYQP